MTVDEIFSQLVAHSIEGLMVHSQLAEYYDFLGLDGYSKCHEYHYFEESCNYKKICRYYIKHYNKIPIEAAVPNPRIIPDGWYHYFRQDVDINTRKASIIAGFEKWVNWERNTKKLYEQFYRELIAIDEVAGAIEVKKYIECVDEELAQAQQKVLELKCMDYDISTIINEQVEEFKKYKKKMREIDLC